MISKSFRALGAFALLFAAGHAGAQQIAIAHRGASSYAPEHTFFAYDLAMEMGADMIECDAFLTKDEVVVCIHDQTIDRTSDGSGNVQDYTLAQLRKFDFGSWYNTANPGQARPEYAGASIVPFEEQLDCYLRHNQRMRFHVETKDSAGGRAEQVITDMLTRKGLISTGDIRNSTIVMQSFDAGSLERMKQLAPTLPTAFLFAAPTTAESIPWALTGVAPDYIDAVAPNSAFILAYPASVALYHANGLDVHAWTVDAPAQINLLLQLGVDGIFTNKTDVVRAAIDERGTGTTPEERGNPAEFERGCKGIAGRVSTNQGPGDVWEPLEDARGVRQVQAYEAPAPGKSSALKTSRFGGALPLGLLMVLFGAAALRRK